MASRFAGSAYITGNSEVLRTLIYNYVNKKENELCGDEEMAQPGKHLHLIHEDQGSMPQNPHYKNYKASVVTQACNPQTGAVETGRGFLVSQCSLLNEAQVQ